MSRLLLAAAAACVVATGGAGLLAQGPLRQQELNVPGLGVPLRAGWQMLFRDSCRFSVPVTWHAAPDSGYAGGPDGGTLAVWAQYPSNWTTHKSQLKMVLSRPGTQVREDSAQRLWIEDADGIRTRHYIAATDGIFVCEALLELPRLTLMTTDRVDYLASSIGPAPAVWPSQLR